jgi:hypothetical protein
MQNFIVDDTIVLSKNWPLRRFDGHYEVSPMTVKSFPNGFSHDHQIEQNCGNSIARLLRKYRSDWLNGLQAICMENDGLPDEWKTTAYAHLGDLIGWNSWRIPIF